MRHVIRLLSFKISYETKKLEHKSLIATEAESERKKGGKLYSLISFSSLITYSVVSTDTLTTLFQGSSQMDNTSCAQPHGYAKPAIPDK